MNIKEQMSNFQIIKEGFEKYLLNREKFIEFSLYFNRKDQEIRVEELNSKRNNDGLEKEYIKLKEIFESEKRKITDYVSIFQIETQIIDVFLAERSESFL